MVRWVLGAVEPLSPDPLVVVSSPDSGSAVKAELSGGSGEIVIQPTPGGTAEAVRVTRTRLEAHEGDIVVLAGDVPLITTEILDGLLETHGEREAAATVLSFVPPDAGSYGRVLRDDRGYASRIVEARDASPEELEIDEVNSSIYVFRSSALWPALDHVRADNVQDELYLTDVVRLIVDAGEQAAVYQSPDAVATEGVNTQEELAAAAAVLRDRINARHMDAGVSLYDPVSTWIEPEVEIESDAMIYPFTVLRGRTVVRHGAEVGPHAVVADSEVGPGALVGPFCYLRPGTVLGEGAKAGTFVEMKNSNIGRRTKVPHLSYVGDADVGDGTNVAAGAITANYRAELGGKFRTKIGDNVHTGSHNVFVPPVEIGDDAWIAAGSTITEDVPPGALGIARSRQVNKEGYDSDKRSD